MVGARKIEGWKCSKCGQIFEGNNEESHNKAIECCQHSDKVYVGRSNVQKMHNISHVQKMHNIGR